MTLNSLCNHSCLGEGREAAQDWLQREEISLLNILIEMRIKTHLKFWWLTLDICDLVIVQSARVQVHHATDSAESDVETEAARGPSDYREFICELPTWSKLQY